MDYHDDGLALWSPASHRRAPRTLGSNFLFGEFRAPGRSSVLELLFFFFFATGQQVSLICSCVNPVVYALHEKFRAKRQTKAVIVHIASPLKTMQVFQDSKMARKTLVIPPKC